MKDNSVEHPMISFRHLTKQFGSVTAVDDLSFDVDAREAVALWGPNGAGKTSVLKCLLGLLRYDGTICVDGSDARRYGRKVRRNLGYVPQRISFYDDMTAGEMIHFFARLKKCAYGTLEDVLGEVGLSGQGNTHVGALSGGMKQRLALALALLGDPAILVLDEPTSSLDLDARDHFLELLVRLRSEGRTIVFTSHRLEEIEQLADRVVVMAGGSLQLTCRANELARRLGLQARIKLRLLPEMYENAVTALRAGGYTVSPNGAGIMVDVHPGEKAGPIQVLNGAGISVTDFEVES